MSLLELIAERGGVGVLLCVPQASALCIVRWPWTVQVGHTHTHTHTVHKESASGLFFLGYPQGYWFNGCPFWGQVGKIKLNYPKMLCVPPLWSELSFWISRPSNQKATFRLYTFLWNRGPKSAPPFNASLQRPPLPPPPPPPPSPRRLSQSLSSDC